MKSPALDIVASGYPSLDRIIKISSPPRSGITSLITNHDNGELYYGGCNVNICCLCAKMGIKAAPVMNVGYDYESSGFQSFLMQSSVDCRGISMISDARTSCSYIIEEPSGSHITLFYPGAMHPIYAGFADETLVSEASWAVITVGETAYNLDFLHKCQRHSIPVVLGMKCDFDAFSKSALKELIEASSIVFMNNHEADQIMRIFAMEHISDLLWFKTPYCLVITKGKKGCEIMQKHGDKIFCESIESVEPERLEDSTGAGDACIAGFLFGLIRGLEYDDCARIGSVLASFILEVTGTLNNAPTVDQINQRALQYYSKELIK